jgi:hypothetical protein
MNDPKLPGKSEEENFYGYIIEAARAGMPL